MIALWWALAAGVLPPAEQYTLGSFPPALQQLLEVRERHPARPTPQAIFLVQRLPAGKSTKLWIVADQIEDRPKSLLFMQTGGRFEPVGVFAGAIQEAWGDDRSPPALVLEESTTPDRSLRTELAFKDGQYRAGKAEKLIVDPLTRAELSRRELDRAAEDDYVAGRDLAAAGRWAALCESGCSAAQHAKQGRAALRAGLPLQAETALRAALKIDPKLDDARLDLGDALAAEGKIGEARAAYAAAARSQTPEIVTRARDRLAKIIGPR